VLYKGNGQALDKSTFWLKSFRTAINASPGVYTDGYQHSEVKEAIILGSLLNLLWLNEFTVSAQLKQLHGFRQQQKRADAT